MAWGLQTQRIAAASQALGAPKGVQKQAKPNLPRGKPQVQRTAPKQMPRANPHPNRPGQNQHAHAGPPVDPESRSLLELNPRQIAQRGTHMAQLQQKAELSPLQGQAKELSGTEAAAQARFKALGEQQNTNLSGLVAAGESSAKTNENRAADLALKTGKSVESSGQAEAGQLGGYVSPELKAQMLAAGQRASETTGANQSLAQQSGQNEVNYLNNLRAAAAAKVTEGSRQIAAPYAKALNENSASQRSAIAKFAPNAAKFQQELGREAFNQKAVVSKLGAEGAKTKLLTEKLGVEKQNAATNAFKAKTGAQTAAEKLRLEGRKLGFNEWATREKVAISKLSATDQARYHEAQVRAKEKPANPKEGRKYMGELAKGLQLVKGVIGSHNEGRGNASSQAAARKALAEKGASSDQIAAILNLAVYGRLSTADQATAISYGLTPNLRPEWFRKK